MFTISVFIFQANPCKHPIVILRDVKEADMRALLRFIYHGEVQLEESRLADFLKTADTLQIQGLSDGAASAIPVNSSSSADDNALETGTHLSRIFFGGVGRLESLSFNPS